MKIDILTNLEQIDHIKKDWDSIYEKDENASFFLSWPWVRSWCEVTPFRWIVLTAQKESSTSPVAFLPLGFRTHKVNRFFSSTDFVSSGSAWADHSGFVCIPDESDAALSAFALFLKKKIRWDSLSLNEISDPRFVFFTNLFQSRNFQIKTLKQTECPYIELPETWDQYCLETISKRAHKDINYYVRRIKRDIDFRSTSITKDNLKDSIEILLSLYEKRRQPQYRLMVDRFREILTRSFQNNFLWLNVLWDGVKPIAACSAFLDRKNSTFVGCNTGFDENYSKLRPGTVIFSESVKYAIENGFKYYDFGRGTEEYKYTFGAKDRFNSNTQIIKNTPASIMKNAFIKMHFILKKHISKQKEL
ncbi:MAG: hypothetical protein C0403_17850 [Desulfobacterium sp.]|nr:hypothetical protein [Desulfobacterium sp.]